LPEADRVFVEQIMAKALANRPQLPDVGLSDCRAGLRVRPGCLFLRSTGNVIMSNAQHIQSATTPSGLKRVVAAMAGTVAEWYEFFLYGTASALVFGQLFFRQTDSPIDGIIAAFALYAVGFLARPLGGLVFGHYGDKFGRKRLLQLSLVVVGITTFLMGCLPGFDQIGYAAPVLLVLLRLIQGFAFGGEWGGAILLVSEHCPDNRRGFWASWPQAGVPAGNLVATVALLLLSSNLSEQQFLAWGWRVAFWFSAVVVLIGYWIRTRSMTPRSSRKPRPARHRPASNNWGWWKCCAITGVRCWWASARGSPKTSSTTPW
jgi:MFS family permease